MRCDLGFISEVSLFRSAIRVDSLVALPTTSDRIAAPEFGNMSSLIKLVKAKKRTVPSVSLRCIFSYGDKARAVDTVRLFAYSKEAYQLLCEAVTEATAHSHYEPRLEIERLNQLLRSNDDLYAIVSQDFSFHDLLETKHTYLSINAESDLGHPMFRKLRPVFFHPSHALKREDFAVTDCFPGGGKMNRNMYYENADHFNFASLVPESLENYDHFMQRDFTTQPIELKNKLPVYSDDDEELFKALTYAGFRRRYPVPTPRQIERLEYEIAMIIRMGFPSYLLIVWDFIDWAKTNGISVGPGRGSAAGSLVCYCLGITQLCPLEHDLFFERFLNPDRVSMPDIDVDFSKDRRQEVIRYIEEKYGIDRVCQIITFGKLKSKSAFKDACRVAEIPADEANNVTKLWPPSKFGVPPELSEVYKFDQIREWIERSPRNRDVWEKAKYMEGFIRQEGIHAAGVVIAPENVVKFAPVSVKPTGRACQFDKDDSEKYGLLKMDLLGLQCLDTLQMACQLCGLDFYGLYDLPLDDPEVYRQFSLADTHGVFQFESRGMQDLLRRIDPTCFDDITAATALYRPGPLQGGLTDSYVRNKQSLVEIVSTLPEFKVLLADTYEVFVYQEQIMKIAQEIAGFTLSKADILRKAIGKKDNKLMAEMGAEFLQGAVQRGQSAAVIETLWKQIQGFGDYCFNKSHSAAYSLLSYYCMWFKVHHPKEYVLALLTADMGNSKEMAGHFFHFQNNVVFEYPRMNECQRSYSVSPTGVMIGLGSIKELGFTEQFEQKFDSLSHFLEKVDIDKTKLTQLIYGGFFDGVFPDRELLLGNVPEMLAYSKNVKSSKRMFLFDIEVDSGFHFNEGKRKRVSLTTQESLAFGFNIKEGFIIKHAKVIETFDENTIAITVHAVKRLKTKKKQEDMAIISGYSTMGEIDLMVFPQMYKQFGHRLMEDKTYIIKFSISPANETYSESYILEDCVNVVDFVPKKLLLLDNRGYRPKQMSELPVLTTGLIKVYYEGEEDGDITSTLAGYIDVLNDEYLDSLPKHLSLETVVFLDKEK